MPETVRQFFDARNRSTRIDVFEELSEQTQVALRTFARRMGAPHLLDEVVLPRLHEGDSRVVVAVQDRPWPPWGLGARQVLALCQTHVVDDESYAISPVYTTDDDLTNVGMISAVFKEALEQVAVSPRAELCYLVAEGSTLVHAVLTRNGFKPSDDMLVDWAGRYYAYRAPVAEVLAHLGLDKLATPDLLAHDMEPSTLEANALYHSTLYLGNRAEWAAERSIAEIIAHLRGGASGKPGGVPSGTGQWAFDPEEMVELEFRNLLTQDQVDQLVDHLVANEARFTPATVIPSGEQSAAIDESLRRARTLDDLGPFQSMITDALKERLAPALQRLGHPAFEVGRIEMQATASNDGDYFRLHPDSDAGDTREISFVLFLHRLPRRFSGGELRIFKTRTVDGRMARADHSHTVSPRPGSLVLFPATNQHEILPVRVPSGQFADSRFTINGWIHRAG
jgi:Rps23 Pro-64 3,4-dihydroxylase Tpa1-like proline 4-hydroxylase